MRLHRITFAILLCMAVNLLGSTAYAYDRDKHDDDISRVLFGVADYKSKHLDVSETITALEDATYLALDQFNGKGQDALDYLKNRRIPDIPSSIAEINFTSNNRHRKMTHKGWNYIYNEDAHWETRKNILINTVEQELFINSDTPLSWFPWLSGIIFGRNGTEEQQESFCILLYYIHIIGDYMEAKEYQDLVDVAPLVNPDDHDNPGIIPEILLCFDFLFEDQKNTFTYLGCIQELKDLQEESRELLQAIGGIDSEEEFIEYHKCAFELFETLEMYVPKLLKNENFFRERFYE